MGSQSQSTTIKNKKQCVAVNAYLRALDVALATTFVADMPCAQYTNLVSTIASKFAPNSSLSQAKRYVLQGVMCRGKIVANVASMRRKLSRISCSTVNGRVVVTNNANAYKDKYPLPNGFVVPRLWDPKWTSTWARKNGWIKDPYYDWLMPAKQVPATGGLDAVAIPIRAPTVTTTAGAAASVSNKPLKQTVYIPGKETVSSVPVKAPKPKPKPTTVDTEDAPDTPEDTSEDAPEDTSEDTPEDTSEDTPEDTEDTPEKTEDTPEDTADPKDTPEDTLVVSSADPKDSGVVKFLKDNWIWILCGLGIVIALFLLFQWWGRRRSQGGTSDVDMAFEQAPPQTDIPLETPGLRLPNTTELMKALENPTQR